MRIVKLGPKRSKGVLMAVPEGEQNQGGTYLTKEQ
jgi:hypothetical protein